VEKSRMASYFRCRDTATSWAVGLGDGWVHELTPAMARSRIVLAVDSDIV
jgi:hypothetical protein